MEPLFLFLAEGFEEIEAVSTLDILRRAGLDVKSVSVTAKKEVVGAHGMPVVADLLFRDIEEKEASCLILPGGMPGTKHLNEHRGVVEWLEKQHEQNGWIAAICAAPSILGRLGMLQNRKAVCYPGFESELTGARIGEEPTAVDGHLITANGPGSASLFALAIVEQLSGCEKAKEVASGMLL